MLTACPDCGGNLGRDAEKCRCGWKRGSVAPRLLAECAYQGCVTSAVIREQTPTGWANLCEFHWLQAHTRRAEENCRAKGLFTTEQKKAYCRKMLGRLITPAVEREPGQDDEERNDARAETSA